MGNWQTVQTQIRCRRIWHLIRVSTVCKKFIHFSLGISKPQSRTYLKLKVDSSYSVCVCVVGGGGGGVSLFSLGGGGGESIQSTMG